MRGCLYKRMLIYAVVNISRFDVRIRRFYRPPVAWIYIAVLIACTRVYLFVRDDGTSTVTYGLIKFTYGLRLMRINLLTGF